MQFKFFLAASAASVSLASGLAAPAYAQETSSAVRGVIQSNNAPVSGANVTIVHTPSGTTATVSSDASGGFSANGLRVGGPFQVTVEAAGYETAVVNDLYLQAGQPFRLPIALLPQTEIVVTAANLTGAIETSTGPITTLRREDIEGVASINRDVRDLARRDPFVTLDPTNSRTIEIAGNNGRLNRFSVDGTTFGDDFGLNNGGLPTSRGPVPFDAIEEFSVKVAPFDISEGEFSGGAINVVLRSGGNKFQGSGFFSYTDDKLTGKTSRGSTTNLDFTSKQYGGTLSGPIIKDKLFFMTAYERTEESDPFDNGIGAGFANQIPNLTQAQVDNITAIAKSVYGYDTLGVAPNAVEKDEKLAVKLDWNVTDGHRLAATYIRNTGTQLSQQNTSISRTSPTLGYTSNAYTAGEEVNSGTLELNSNWTDAISTQLRVSYRDYNRAQTAQGDPFAQMTVCLDPTSAGTATSCTTGVPRLTFGPDIFRHANAANTENLNADFTMNLRSGDHDLKLNVGFTRVHTYNLFQRRALGELYFDSIEDFQNRKANQLQLRASVPSLIPADAAADFTGRQWTFGLQDEWLATDNLTLTFGARYDLYDTSPAPSLGAGFLARNGFSNRSTLKGRGVFQPRFAFNWDASDRVIVKGGIGVFAAGSPDVFVANSFSNTGAIDNEISITRSNCGTSGTCSALDNVDGVNYPKLLTDYLIGSLSDAPVNAIDPDFRIPRQMRGSLSVNYEADFGSLGQGWLLGADVLYSETLHGYQWTDLRSVAIGTMPDGRTRYGARANSSTINQDLLMTNDDRGRSIIGVARFAKSWDFGLSIGGSYTRQDVKDVNALTSSQAASLYSNNAFSDPNFAAYGRSIYEISNSWKFDIDFKQKFFGDNETRIGLFGEYRSGRPYSLTMLDSTGTSGRGIFGTVANGGRMLLYVPTLNDTKVVFDNPASEAAFNQLVTQLGLEKYRGQILPKNSQTSPDVFKVDMHFSQELPLFIGGSKLKLFGDIENVLNMIDSDWGAIRQVGFPYTSTLVAVACAATSGSNCTQYRYSSVLAPNEGLQTRQSLYGIRVGVKVSF